MKRKWMPLMFLLILGVTSCSTMDPTAGKTFDIKNKKQCIKVCKKAEMSFDALVVVGGMSGCVCGNNRKGKVSSSSAVMGGQVAALAAEAARRSQAAQQKRP